MAQYLLEFEEAIDRKFIVTKTVSGQAKVGTMIHVLDCVPKGNGAHTVWYRVNETGQDFSQGFASVKEFCNWARTDKILIRHYESLSRRDVMQYLKITNGGFTRLFLPVLIIALILIWVVMLAVVGGAAGIAIGVILSLLATVATLFLYKNKRKKAILAIYSKVSKNNWGVTFK
ncbi:MAG: hypothetical protein IKV85_05020 [Ruminococcus sp.]|nr:hypothetical protein [Ruminococcus sp.]